MSSIGRWFFLLVLSFGLEIGALPGLAVELQLVSVKLPTGEVHFNINVAEAIDSLPIAVGAENVQTVSTRHYTIHISLDDIRLNKYGFIRYRFYVSPKPGVPGRISSFVVNGEPIGSIPAQLADVDLYVGEDAGKMEPGRISLPVFSPDSDYLAAALQESGPLPVGIGETTSIQIPLKNLQRWAVSVEGVHSPIRNSLWREAVLLVKGSPEFHQFEVQPSAAIDDVLVLRLVPNSVPALAEVLFPRRTDKEPELVTASLDYTNRFGAPRSLGIKVPVQFVPGTIALVLSVIGGTLLGSVIPVVAGQRTKQGWVHAFPTSLLTAFLIWSFAWFLVMHNSELKLLGFTFDPRQLLSAALIGALLGLLGFKSLEILAKIIPGLGQALAAQGAGVEPK